MLDLQTERLGNRLSWIAVQADMHPGFYLPDVVDVRQAPRGMNDGLVAGYLGIIGVSILLHVDPVERLVAGEDLQRHRLGFLQR